MPIAVKGVALSPPYAPQLLAPTLGSYNDAFGAGVAVSWAYNAPAQMVNGVSATLPQTAWALQLYLADPNLQNVTTYWWSVASSSFVATETWNTGNVQSVKIPAGQNQLANGHTYAFTVATQNANGRGGYANSVSFYAQDPPTLVINSITPNLVPDTSDLHTWSLSNSAISVGPSPLGGNQFTFPQASLSQNLYAQSQQISLLPNSTYTISSYVDASQATSGAYIAIRLASGFLSVSYAAGFKGTLSGVITTGPADTTGAFFLQAPTTANTGSNIIMFQPQLVLGSTSLPYTQGQASGNVGAWFDAFPPISWHASYPLDAFQIAYQVCIYPEAVTQISGFTPGQVQGALFDSGVVVDGVAQSIDLSTFGNTANPLFPTSSGNSSVVYVQVTEKGGQTSPWQTFIVSIDYSAPPVPSLVASVGSANGLPVGNLQAIVRGNMLAATDAIFKAGVGGWATYGYGSVVQSSNYTLSGGYSLALYSNGNNLILPSTGFYPVVAGAEYTALASLLVPVLGLPASLRIDWFDSAKSQISYISSPAVVDARSGWTQMVASGVAPTTAAYATVQVYIAGNNLLTVNDASFEGGVGSWVSNGNSTVAQSSAEALQGTYSLAVTATAAGASSAQTGLYPVVAGQTYNAILSSLAAATSENVKAGLAWFNSSGGYISITQGAALADSTSEWTQASVKGVAPTGATSVRVVATWTNAAAGEIHYIDEIALYTGAPSVNLVPDTSDLHTWDMTHAGGIFSIAPSPLGGNQFQALGVGSATGADYPLSQLFPMQPNTTYTVSCYIDATSLTAGAAYIEVGINNNVTWGDVSQPAGSKGTVSTTFTTPAGVTEGQVWTTTGGSTIANGQYLIFSQPQLTLGSTPQPYVQGSNWSAGQGATDYYLNEVSLSQGAPSANLIPDTSDLHTWNMTNAGGIFSIAPSPLGGNQFQVLGNGAGSGYQFPLSQVFTVVPGETYVLSAYIDATYVTSGSPTIQLYTPQITQGYIAVAQAVGSKGTLTSAPWTCPAGVTEAVVLCDTGGSTIVSGQYLTFAQPQLTLGSTPQPYVQGSNWSGGTLNDVTYAEFQFSDDQGPTQINWSDLRNGVAIPVQANFQTPVVVDEEIPPAQVRYYRVRVYSRGGSSYYYGAWS